MDKNHRIVPRDWESIQMESPKGVTLGEWYKSLPKEKAIEMKTIICQHLVENLPLTEEALLKTWEEIKLDSARYLGNI